MPSKIAIYGLSTEGYYLASSLVMNGYDVSIVDESSKMAIPLNEDLARTYSTPNDIIEDESLLQTKNSDSILNNCSYLFFCPKIRKVGTDVKIDVSSKFIDAIKPIKKDSSIIYTLPVGINGNSENIDILEHTTGMEAGDNIFYYYMPINSGPLLSTNINVGQLDYQYDPNLENMISAATKKKVAFIPLESSELSYISKILRHYSGISSIIEVCKHANGISNPLTDPFYKDLYIDDIGNGLHDLRIIQTSLHGSTPMMYLINGTIRSIEGYVKYLIDTVRKLLKKRDLKASKTKVSLFWTLDFTEMRGDKLDMFSLFESKLRDYIGDVEPNGRYSLDQLASDKTNISIACSKTDYNFLCKNSYPESIIIKANPIYEVV
ncbi:MAG: hypothetical protein ACPKQO_05060 [Nitrososphaeraceae archaeon]